MKFGSIPLDAIEVALYSGFGAPPRIYQVEKHTPKHVVAGDSRFHRDSGKQLSSYSNNKWIGVVTPEVLSRIEAAKLQDTITDLERKVRNVEARHVARAMAVAKGKDYSTNLQAAQRAVRELDEWFKRRLAELPEDELLLRLARHGD